MFNQGFDLLWGKGPNADYQLEPTCKESYSI